MAEYKKRKPSWLLNSDEEEERNKEKEEIAKEKALQKQQKLIDQLDKTPVLTKKPSTQTKTPKSKSPKISMPPRISNSQPLLAREPKRKTRKSNQAAAEENEDSRKQPEEGDVKSRLRDPKKKSMPKMPPPCEVDTAFLRQTWATQLKEGLRYIFTEPLGTEKLPSPWNRVKYSQKGKL